jgi:aspartate aminotransferase
MRDRTLTVNGVSKSYAMTGWRVGYGAGPKVLIDGINTVMSQTTTHTSTVSQHAATVALNGPQEARERYSEAMAKRAKLAFELARDLPGCKVFAPEGAFYCYVNCEGLIGRRASGTERPLDNDVEIARYLLSNAHVAVVPGAAYGLSPYIRFSFAMDEGLLTQGLSQMRQALSRLE